VIALHTLCDSPLHILHRPRIISLDKKNHLRRLPLSLQTAVQLYLKILLKSAPLSFSHSTSDILTQLFINVNTLFTLFIENQAIKIVFYDDWCYRYPAGCFCLDSVHISIYHTFTHFQIIILCKFLCISIVNPFIRHP